MNLLKNQQTTRLTLSWFCAATGKEWTQCCCLMADWPEHFVDFLFPTLFPRCKTIGIVWKDSQEAFLHLIRMLSCISFCLACENPNWRWDWLENLFIFSSQYACAAGNKKGLGGGGIFFSAFGPIRFKVSQNFLRQTFNDDKNADISVWQP